MFSGGSKGSTSCPRMVKQTLKILQLATFTTKILMSDHFRETSYSVGNNCYDAKFLIPLLIQLISLFLLNSFNVTFINIKNSVIWFVRYYPSSSKTNIKYKTWSLKSISYTKVYYGGEWKKTNCSLNILRIVTLSIFRRYHDFIKVL